MLKIIKTESEYENALERAYFLMQQNLTPNSAHADELEMLTLFIEHYERAHYPILPPSPIEAVKFRLDQLGKPTSELGAILGAKSRQSEILNGKRKLSLNMIRKLHQILNIPAESLIAVY